MKTKYTLVQRIILLMVPIIGPPLIWLYGKTWRVYWTGLENLDRAHKISDKVIYVFWHSRLLGLTYTHRSRQVGIMVSKSFDGEWISRIVKNMGYHPIRGSSTRDGASAMIHMIAESQSRDLAITVDGPRGPAEKAKSGAFLLAAACRMPLVPITIVADKAWRLNTWDRFIIPAPFTGVTVKIGEPIEIPPDLSREKVGRYAEIAERAISGLG